MVRYRCPVLAEAFAGLIVCEVEAVDVSPISFCFVDGVKVFAVNIFDKGPFGLLLWRDGVADDGGYAGQAGGLGGRGAAVAGDEFVAVGGFSGDKNRLQDAMDADGIDQFGEVGKVDGGSGLMGIGIKLVDGNGFNHAATVGCGGVGRVGFGR